MMKPIQLQILHTAIDFLGKKEIPGNMGFVDHDFQGKMKEVGWEMGQAWCAYFVEMVWRDVYKKYSLKTDQALDKLFSALAVANYTNFRKDKRFTCNTQPEIGSVVIWQKYQSGKPDWRGHAGIVIGSVPGGFISIEGNTNSQGGREGMEVAMKHWEIDFNVTNGLRLKGFIHPVDPEILIS